MKKHLAGILKGFDQFGAPLLQQFGPNESTYRSVIGGIVTILVFFMSIAYSVFVIYQWQTNQLLPKIQSSDYVSDFTLLDLNYDVIRICYWKPSPNLIDPFEAKVLIPIVAYTENYNITQTKVLRLSKEVTTDGNRFLIPKMQIGFTNFQGNLINTSEMFIYFVKCDQSLLDENEQCASEDTVAQFYSQPANQIIIYITQKKVNPEDKSFKTNIQQYGLLIENLLCVQQAIYLQSTLYEINDSFLFGQSNKYELLNGAQIQTITSSLAYCKMAFGYETYASLYFGISTNQIKQVYQYPHAGDLLANIGSIISTLFLLKYMILFTNNKYLISKKRQLMNQLQYIIVMLSRYKVYPEYQNIKINRNWRGKILSVNHYQSQLDPLEQQQFIDFLQNITKQVKLKLSIINLIYENSRIYFILRSQQSKSQLKRVHQIGIRFGFLKEKMSLNTELQFSSRFQDQIQQQQYLNDDDVGLLSLDQRDITNVKDQTEKVPDEIENPRDYFDINKLIF